MISTNGSPTKVTRGVLRALEKTIGPLPAEQGGVLGRDRETGVIAYFHFDATAAQTRITYAPDGMALDILWEAWHRSGVLVAGFAHSHPPDLTAPSSGDIEYANAIFAANPQLTELLLPILMTERDSGSFQVIWWRLVRNSGAVPYLEKFEPEIVEDNLPVQKPQDTAVSRPMLRVAMPEPLWLADGRFDRVENSACNMARLATARVIVVGVGGAAGFVDDLAKASVGEIVLIDPDTVSIANLATQQFYEDDIGKPKVACVARQVKRTNSNAVTVCIQKRIEDLPDSEIFRLAFGYSRVIKKLQARIVTGGAEVDLPVDVRLRPSVTVLMGMTDNFYAQARVARLSVQLGLPCLLAGLYGGGRGMEVVWSYPGVTPACPRCALHQRYDAYLRDGFQNDVTSDGAPICATTRLNAHKGFMTLALLHHGTKHPRWDGILDRIATRNLTQIRFDPDLKLRTFDHAFAGVQSGMLFFDESVFVPCRPVPGCEDCGGSGNLWDAVGRFKDTRQLFT